MCFKRVIENKAILSRTPHSQTLWHWMRRKPRIARSPCDDFVQDSTRWPRGEIPRETVLPTRDRSIFGGQFGLSRALHMIKPMGDFPTFSLMRKARPKTLRSRYFQSEDLLQNSRSQTFWNGEILRARTAPWPHHNLPVKAHQLLGQFIAHDHLARQDDQLVRSQISSRFYNVHIEAQTPQRAVAIKRPWFSRYSETARTSAIAGASAPSGRSRPACICSCALGFCRHRK